MPTPQPLLVLPAFFPIEVAKWLQHLHLVLLLLFDDAPAFPMTVPKNQPWGVSGELWWLLCGTVWPDPAPVNATYTLHVLSMFYITFVL